MTPRQIPHIEVDRPSLKRWLDMGGNRARERRLNMIVVHCSDTPNERHVTAADIRGWHIQDNHWSDIGYHYVIRRDGMIEKGRPDDKAGAHVRGFNAKSVGICLIGRGRFEPVQLESLAELLGLLKSVYRIDIKNILGHYELDDGKTCPNMDGNKIRELVT